MLFLLLVAGAVVRTTGSGMGCPDWPKCFGMTIPPTSVEQLPYNYQEIYKDHGYAEQGFNVYKTWTEYINRLIGALTGLVFLLQLMLAFSLDTEKRFHLSMAALVLVLTAFQAWLGGRVVQSNLSQSLVTWHMLLAVLILALLLLMRFKILFKTKLSLSIQMVVPTVALLMVIVQVVLGTQVREQVDDFIKLSYDDRSLWVGMLDQLYLYHREMYVATALFIIIMVMQQYKKAKTSPIRRFTLFAAILVLLQGATGFVMSYMAFPPFAQALHLVLAIFLFSALFWNILLRSHALKPEHS